jgi:hypothetical protein
MKKEDLQVLKNLQESFSLVSQTIKEKKELFEKSIEEETERLNFLKDSISRLKEDLELEAREEFKEKGKKKLLGGLGVREVTYLDYDPKRALEWAKEKGLCLLLDTKKFEKIALDAADFVEEKKRIQITFPKEIKLEE